MGFNLIYLWDKPEEMKRMLSNILNFNLKKPYIGSTFSFDKLPEALKHFQSGKTIGKVIVII
jgi:alcohol dehydrogenase